MGDIYLLLKSLPHVADVTLHIKSGKLSNTTLKFTLIQSVQYSNDIIRTSLREKGLC